VADPTVGLIMIVAAAIVVDVLFLVVELATILVLIHHQFVSTTSSLITFTINNMKTAKLHVLFMCGDSLIFFP
jgi:hypothetical protein